MSAGSKNHRGTLLGVAACAVLSASILFASLSGGAAIAAESATAAPRFVPHQLLVRFEGEPERLIKLPGGVGVKQAQREFAGDPGVAYANPNYVATAAGWYPNDPGQSGTGDGWEQMQWNFLPCGALCDPGGNTTGPQQSIGGIDAPGAWEILRQRHHGGAKGVKIAVLDTGIAYRRKGTSLKSPDFTRSRFMTGHDFVGNDKLALDEDGHGTHVAGTIGEDTDNGKALTGLAYKARLMPVRVLNRQRKGTARNIARGIRFAAKHGAQVINMSLEFPAGITRCKQIRAVCRAVKYALRKRVVLIAAAGNGATQVALPARISGVLGVGASTEGACPASYSSNGSGLDLLAPGGTGESPSSTCPHPSLADRGIFQLTFTAFGDPTSFGYPPLHGTSMASAHASGVAAMVIASGVLGRKPSPAKIQCQLRATARHTTAELGGNIYSKSLYGAGIIDAAAAVGKAAC